MHIHIFGGRTLHVDGHQDTSVCTRVQRLTLASFDLLFKKELNRNYKYCLSKSFLVTLCLCLDRSFKFESMAILNASLSSPLLLKAYMSGLFSWVLSKHKHLLH